MNNQALLKKIKDIGNVLSINNRDNINSIPSTLDKFIHNIGLTSGLRKQGIQAKHVAKLVNLAFGDTCHATHPFPITIENITAVYTRAL